MRHTYFKENKSLNGFKQQIKNKHGGIGIAAFKYGFSVSTLYNVLNGTQHSIKLHRIIAEDLNIPWNMYVVTLKDVYREDALNWEFDWENKEKH